MTQWVALSPHMLQVTIPVPDVKAREEILDILINKHGLRVKKHDPEKTEVRRCWCVCMCSPATTTV